MCGLLGHLAPVHRCASLVCYIACAASSATLRQFKDVHTRCVVLRVRCPWPIGYRSPVCLLGVLCVPCPGPLCSRSLVYHLGVSVVCAVSLATSPQFKGVQARCVVLHVRRPWPLGYLSPVCLLGVLCARCPSPLCPVHRCASSVCCVVCAVSSATSRRLKGVHTWCVALRVRCPWSLGCCSPVCILGVSCCVCGNLGHFAPVHRCACFVCCVVGAVSLANWLPFTGVSAECAVCAVSLATWVPFTGVPARGVVLPVRCPWPLGSCSPVCLFVLFCIWCSWPLAFYSPVCPLGVLCCMCAVLGHLAPVHRCARLSSFAFSVHGRLAPVHWCACSMCCVASAVSLATWRLFTGVLARCAVCAASLVTWLLFIALPAPCVVLCVQCPWPLGCCSPVCPLGVV